MSVQLSTYEKQLFSHFKVESVQKKQRFYSGIRICRIARIQAFSF
jgi:hypothetical protein